MKCNAVVAHETGGLDGNLFYRQIHEDQRGTSSKAAVKIIAS